MFLAVFLGVFTLSVYSHNTLYMGWATLLPFQRLRLHNSSWAHLRQIMPLSKSPSSGSSGR